MRRTGRGGQRARCDHHEIAHRGCESVRQDRVFEIGPDGKGSLLRGPIDFEFDAKFSAAPGHTDQQPEAHG